MQASVLYDNATGHVFALATTAAPSKAPSADQPAEMATAVRALAGDTLRVRGYYLDGATWRVANFSIRAERLALLTSEVESDVLLSPRKYSVRDHKTVELSPAVPLPALVLGGNSDELTLTLGAETPEELPVMLQVVPDAGVAGDVQTAQGTFRPASSTKQTLKLTLVAPLATGGHTVLVLVRGCRFGMDHITAT